MKLGNFSSICDMCKFCMTSECARKTKGSGI